jgi:2-dehydro-3-deoxyphosphogalactonate aldolase
MTGLARFEAGFAACPLVAILRGIEPAEADAVGDALVEAGFGVLEVPLNSPEPFRSIERLARRLGAGAAVGAGTVLSAADVARCRDAGAAFVVAPNCDPEVIRTTAAAGTGSLPGVFTPSEAFAALAAGAHALKLFPAEAAPPRMIGAIKAVLPQGTRILPVGGVDETNLAHWRRAGADGAGFGSSLFKPGRDARDVGARARRLVAAWGEGAR